MSPAFTVTGCSVPKDAEFPGDNQDAWCADARLGRAALADGVSAGVFSGLWARIASKTFVEQGSTSGEAFAGWLPYARGEWIAGIDWNSLNYFQKKRLNQVRGGYCTLLGIEFHRVDGIEPVSATMSSEQPENIDIPPAEWSLRAYAVGDCNLFHLREGQLLRAFPLESPEQFDLRPHSLSSVDLGSDLLITVHSLCTNCQPGDTLLVASDALAKYLLDISRADSGCWTRIAALHPDEFGPLVLALRDQRAIDRDDTTLLILNVLPIDLELAEETDLYESEHLRPDEQSEDLLLTEEDEAGSNQDCNAARAPKEDQSDECEAAPALDYSPPAEGELGL